MHSIFRGGIGNVVTEKMVKCELQDGEPRFARHHNCKAYVRHVSSSLPRMASTDREPPLVLDMASAPHSFGYHVR